MTNKTTILIGILFFITCGLLYVAITTTPVAKKTAPSPTPTPISVNAKSTLSLVAASSPDSSPSAHSGQSTTSYTVAAVVDSTNKVNAVQIEISYDPAKITNVTLKPGTFFTQPSVLLNAVDTNTGRISYALAEQLDLPGKSGKGTVALISFTLTPAARKGETTTMKLLPKSAVTADKILESVLRQTNDITIPLPVSTGTALQSSPSAK